MSNPQKENGYTSVANEIFESLAKIRINGEARQVLDVVFRKTYGFQKKQDRIALSQFCDLTGLKKPNVCRAIKKLISMNIIIKIDTELGEVYSFQKDHDKWVPLSKKITSKSLSKKIMDVIEKDNASLSKKIHTKETTTKETTTKEIGEKIKTPFEFAKEFFLAGDFYRNVLDDLVFQGGERIFIESQAKNFLLYWTEPNKSGTKARWETEKTFEVKRRFFLWLSRSNGFNLKDKFQIGTV